MLLAPHVKWNTTFTQAGGRARFRDDINSLDESFELIFQTIKVDLLLIKPLVSFEKLGSDDRAANTSH